MDAHETNVEEGLKSGVFSYGEGADTRMRVKAVFEAPTGPYGVVTKGQVKQID